MRYHANACGLDVFFRANACGLDVSSCKRLWAYGVIMQTPVGLMRYRANACGLDAISCKRLWA